MKKFTIILLILSICKCGFCQDEVEALKARLLQLSLSSSNTYFINHCQSFLSVIEAKGELTYEDKALLAETYNSFSNTEPWGNPSGLSSYLNRQRPFIISWTSPTDGALSFSWLKLPANWDPGKEYPLYIELHGLWGVANNPIEYLTYPFREGPSDNFAFQDGYLLSPWGRGNFWYLGISETDIWECMASLESMVKIKPSRKYLCGHSMGGFGAWKIGASSINTWAALGIHAGALWYDQSVMYDEVFESLKDMPTYFVVGNMDGLYNINLTVFEELQVVGNDHTEFVTFEGGHEYLAENVQKMYLWMRNFTNDDWNLGTNPPAILLPLNETMNCIPNPVNNQAVLSFRVGMPTKISIELFDPLGQFVRSLFKGFKISGEYQIDIDVTSLNPGTYTCRLNVNEKINTVKIVVIK